MCGELPPKIGRGYGETQIGHLAAVFSGLAILISCLSLLGLASFIAQQRTKEIGVRKVLGAGMLFITLCTVTFQALKAALMNPITSLRTD